MVAINKDAKKCVDKDCEGCKSKVTCDKLKELGIDTETLIQFDFDLYSMVKEKNGSITDALFEVKKWVGMHSSDQVAVMLISLIRISYTDILREVMHSGRMSKGYDKFVEITKEKGMAEAIIYATKFLGIDSKIVQGAFGKLNKEG